MSVHRELSKRLQALEAKAHAGQTPTTDEDGRPTWIKGSGLALVRRITQASRELGRAAGLQDLSPEDQRLVRLWSRAEPGRSGLSQMVIGACRGLIEIPEIPIEIPARVSYG